MPRNAIVYRPTVTGGGWVEVNPAFAAGFGSLGIDSATGFLELPGEVVSGHPDRHVLRVVLPGFPNAFYLKRQHTVTLRERLRNRLDGFGWSSRCGREAAVLKELQANGLPAPRWAAFGEDGRGRAFLLVEEVAGAADLRHVLSEHAMPPESRARLATRLGALAARLHDAGFTTPDLTAKHVLVSPDGEVVTPIDWQSARRGAVVPEKERVRALAALHASLADELASPRERLRVLRAALGPGRLAEFADLVEETAIPLRERRSTRDQRQPVVTGSAQRLVWVAGEEVCAVPDVAAMWPRAAVAAPFYGCEPGTLPHRLPDGREGVLIRGRSRAPFGRLKARLRGKPWRSPGASLGRILFHLERYGVPAPRLLAFGQRLTGAASAEWFALHTTPPKRITPDIDPATGEQLGRVLRRIHDAGCRPVEGAPLSPYSLDDRGVSVGDVTRVRLTRQLGSHDRSHDLGLLLASIPLSVRAATEGGYHQGEWPHEHHQSRIANTVGVS